jgi:hypothetical protein
MVDLPDSPVPAKASDLQLEAPKRDDRTQQQQFDDLGLST